MMKIFAGLAVLAIAMSAPAPAHEAAENAGSEPVHVMVLGMYHFANPGLDAVNMEVDDVLSPIRQREIAVLVDTLAEWKPTRIAVEAQAEAPDLMLEEFARTEDLLKTTRNESIQIGYRLGRLLGHDAVFGYDEQPSESEPDYFPMGMVQEFAAKNGQSGIIQGLFEDLQAKMAVEQAKLAEQSIAESLIIHNDSELVDAQHDLLYYSMLKIGDGNAQPGAVLNARWYMRNAKMFSKIDMIAQPGDRILVLAGSGHATWLRHFVRRMPGYELIASLPIVKRAAERSGGVEAGGVEAGGVEAGGE